MCSHEREVEKQRCGGETEQHQGRCGGLGFACGLGWEQVATKKTNVRQLQIGCSPDFKQNAVLLGRHLRPVLHDDKIHSRKRSFTTQTEIQNLAHAGQPHPEYWETGVLLAMIA